VKQAEQPNDEWQVRIEHVFRAADQVSPGQQSAGKIDRVDRLEQKQSGRGPRENQRTLQPQANTDQHISKIAKEEEILQSELPPVERRPDEQPDRPADLEPKRYPRRHGSLFYGRSGVPPRSGPERTDSGNSLNCFLFVDETPQELVKRELPA